MKKLILFCATLGLMVSAKVHAQELVPATSQDQQNFDQQVGDVQDTPAVPSTSEGIDVGVKSDDKSVEKDREDSKDKNKKRKERKENFGALVSAEAKRMKELPKEERHQMGEWVSEQRRKDSKHEDKKHEKKHDKNHENKKERHHDKESKHEKESHDSKERDSKESSSSKHEEDHDSEDSHEHHRK